MSTPLHPLDYLIVGFFLVAILTVGLWQARKTKTLWGFFLTDHQQTWPTIGLSLFATSISSISIVGLCGAAYITGIALSATEWIATLLLIFIAIFFLPSFFANNITTMPEFLEKRFDLRVSLYFSLFTIIGNILLEIAGVLFAGVIVLSQFLLPLDWFTAGLIIALITSVYTAAGGLRAVMATNVIQALVLLAGCSCLSFLAFHRIGSWEQIVQLTPPEMLSFLRPASDSTMPWPGLLVGVPLLGFYAWGTNQTLGQQVLAAKNLQQARWGVLFAGLLKLLVIFLIVLPGIMARFIYPHLSMGDAVFPQLIATVLPYGLKGLVLAGFLGAVISTIDSALQSVSTLVTMDLIRKLRPHTPAANLIRIGRIVTLMAMMVGLATMSVLSSWRGLFTYLQTVLSYLVPQIVTIFCLGLFWRRITSRGAFWGLLGGHLFALGIWILDHSSYRLFPGLHLFVWSGIFAFITAAIAIGISYSCRTAPSKPLANFVFHHHPLPLLPENIARPTTWWQDYRYYCVLLGFFTFWLVIAFL